MSRLQASQYCKDQGSKLMTISNDFDIEHVRRFTQYYLDNWPVQIHVNGEFVNGAWSSSDPVAPLFPGAQPTSTNGTCLYAVNGYTSSYVDNPVFYIGAPCGDYPFYCESRKLP
jgi:hypothetical protein